MPRNNLSNTSKRPSNKWEIIGISWGIIESRKGTNKIHQISQTTAKHAKIYRCFVVGLMENPKETKKTHKPIE